jgi:GT2 family glycosyltransferase
MIPHSDWREDTNMRPPPAALGTGVTAAVCTRGRAPVLGRALAALTSQSGPPLEILVVDNAPIDDSVRELVRGHYPMVRYAREPVPGLDFARNRALRDATREVVAFVDDDAVVERDWAAALLDVFARNPRVAVCTGRVEPLSLANEAQRLFEANGGFSRGLAPVRLPADARRPLHGRQAPLIAWAVSIGSGCSYAVRRDVALALGGFDEALDLGHPLPGGGDHDLLWRALEAGYEVAYEPRALAWHEHRSEMPAVRAQIAHHQRALVAFLAKHVVRGRGRTRLSLLAFLTWRLAKPGVRLARRVIGRDPLPESLLLRMWWNCWLGLAAYPYGRFLARRRWDRIGREAPA